jgi:predicted RND superfamily exporter protein
MFKKLKNLFSKKKKSDIISSITIYTDATLNIYIDAQMIDESEESIEHISSILTMFDASSFFKVSNVIREQCKKSNNDELYAKIIENVVGKIGTANFLKDYKESSVKPCINPSEMI